MRLILSFATACLAMSRIRSRITCPIGEPALGKHPQLIAIGVVADVLRPDEIAGTKPETVSHEI